MSSFISQKCLSFNLVSQVNQCFVCNRSSNSPRRNKIHNTQTKHEKFLNKLSVIYNHNQKLIEKSVIINELSIDIDKKEILLDIMKKLEMTITMNDIHNVSFLQIKHLNTTNATASLVSTILVFHLKTRILM